MAKRYYPKRVPTTYRHNCSLCGTPFTSSGAGARYCENCLTRICVVCGGVFEARPCSQRNCCSRKCGNALGGQKRRGSRPEYWREGLRRGAVHSQREKPEIWARLAAQSSERMLRRNPMRAATTRQKMIDTKEQNGTLRTGVGITTQKGGNGRGPTEPQRLLHSRIGGVLEYAVCTGRRPGHDGWPSNYKLDIGFPELQIGFELDGGSHYSLRSRARDRLKDRRLSELGWTVHRWKNSEVLTDIEMVVQRSLDLLHSTI